jgi:hypothetical protein
MKVTATLKMAVKNDNGTYSGDIYGDIHNRWPDGERIRTSLVRATDGDIITTLNNVYRVEMLEDALNANGGNYVVTEGAS